MKAAALLFLVAASFATALILGALSFAASPRSPQPIALRESSAQGSGGAGSLQTSADRTQGQQRFEVPQKVELTTLAAYRAHHRSGRLP